MSLFARASHQTPDARLISLVDPASFNAEQYRRLRQRVEQLSLSKGTRVVAVTSAVAEDGKTTTAINLAASLARPSGARVLLIDADMRQPSVAGRLALPDDPARGLARALRTPGRMVDAFVQQVDGSQLSVLASRESEADPYELLSSSAFALRLDQARQIYDFVIIDTPPVVPVPDSGLLQRAVDGYLVVVAARSTPRRLLAETLNLLGSASVLGLVLNRDERPLFGYYRTRYRRYFNRYVQSLRRASA